MADHSAFRAMDAEHDLVSAGIETSAQPPVQEVVREGHDMPVRVALAGRRGSGKSSIVTLLLGADVLSSVAKHTNLPPIVLRHAAEEQTIAGWWDRPDKAFPGIALETALAENPDLITIELNCDVLQNLWLIDMPALDDVAQDRTALFALSQLTDVMIWCANGCEFGDQDDRAINAKIPAHLRRNAMLALTRMDVMNDQQDEAVQAKLQSGRSLSFRSCSPIAPPLAWKALVGACDTPETLWSDSGAEDLVDAVLAAVTDCRAERLRRGRASMAPPAESVPADPDRPNAAASEDPLPETAEKADLRAIWLEKITALSDQVADGHVADNAAFVAAAQSCVAEFLETLSQFPAQAPGNDTWTAEEFERADNLLTLLQFEEADGIAADAARILLQLGEGFANA